MSFYTGPGVLNFEGKDYAFGEELPAGIPSETIKALKASGKVADTAPVTARSAAASELGTLRDQLQAVGVQLTAARAELATALGERDAARESLEQAQNTIKEMSAAQLSGLQPTAPPAPPVQGAGPKK